MGKRRLALVESSEEEEEELLKTKVDASDSREKKRERSAVPSRKRKGRDEDEDYQSEVEEEKEETEDGDEEDEEEEEQRENVQEDARTIGDVIKVTGKGRNKKNHYRSFEFDNNVFDLEDPVLLTPERSGQKPYVAIIKDITEDTKGSLMVNGQWFYRPEEAEKKGGGKWPAKDTRELFYSWHRDEVPAESVMHRCVVHFIPPTKQLPKRAHHPGFVVQKVYDTENRKLFKLTDRDYEDHFQKEIEHLIIKTRERIGETPDEDVPSTPTIINSPDPSSKIDDDVAMPPFKRGERSVRKRPPVGPIEVPAKNKERLMDKETPGSELKSRAILVKFGVLTGDTYRDKWLDKIVHGLIFNEALDKEKVLYPADLVVPAIATLETVVFDSLAADFSKYNQKMRQLDFNLKNTPILAKRLLNKELEPVVILSMSPNELKEGVRIEEKSTKEPEEPKQLQMTDARCQRCAEKKVGISDIIHGSHGDRYQLECVACGHTWFSSRDAITTLTIDVPNVTQNVGTTPLATAKFEEVEKKLASEENNNKLPTNGNDGFQNAVKVVPETRVN